ncbi:hypothetical protein Tco_0749921 [Tanacetum coccineum]|uniref:Uncharacterized protein n=1 Tax=Tanacetum coccineum TaxID=301880 RepID=A0ABQ4Z2N2_9ASTR
MVATISIVSSSMALDSLCACLCCHVKVLSIVVSVDDFKTEREKQKKNIAHCDHLITELFVPLFLSSELPEVLRYLCHRRNLADELCSVRSVIAPVKASELLNDTLRKDEAKMGNCGKEEEDNE